MAKIMLICGKICVDKFDMDNFECYIRIKEVSCIKKFGLYYESR